MHSVSNWVLISEAQSVCMTWCLEITWYVALDAHSISVRFCILAMCIMCHLSCAWRVTYDVHTVCIFRAKHVVSSSYIVTTLLCVRLNALADAV